MILNKMKASSQLESLLGFSIPEDYRDFIDKTGYLGLGNISMEIYGYRTDFDIEKIPCVIAATRLNKKDYKLTDHELVISHTGFEDLIIILDTVSGCVFEKGYTGSKRKLANSFSTWLTKLVSENAC